MGTFRRIFCQTRSEIRPLIFPHIYASVFLVFALSRYCPILTHPPDFTKTSILQKGGENLLLYLLLKDPPHSERAREREFRGRRGRHFRLSLSLLEAPAWDVYLGGEEKRVGGGRSKMWEGGVAKRGVGKREGFYWPPSSSFLLLEKVVPPPPPLLLWLGHKCRGNRKK